MSKSHEELPNLKRLRAFEAAARLASFTAAAEELHVTQGAVSRQVQALEQDLGMALFDRAGRHLSLNEAGREYADALGEAFQIIRGATRALRPQKEDQVLTITMLPSFAVKWLAPRMADFLEQHPDTDLRISVSHGLSDFADGIDAAIRYGMPPWPQTTSLPLLTDEVFPVCSPGFLEGRPDPLPVPELARMNILHGNAPDSWQDWLKLAGHDDITLPAGPVFDDGATLLQAAMDGAGMALGRSSLADSDLKAGRLIAPFGPRLVSAHGFHLVWPQHQRPPAALSHFRHWLQREISS